MNDPFLNRKMFLNFIEAIVYNQKFLVKRTHPHISISNYVIIING